MLAAFPASLTPEHVAESAFAAVQALLVPPSTTEQVFAAALAVHVPFDQPPAAKELGPLELVHPAVPVINYY